MGKLRLSSTRCQICLQAGGRVSTWPHRSCSVRTPNRFSGQEAQCLQGAVGSRRSGKAQLCGGNLLSSDLSCSKPPAVTVLGDLTFCLEERSLARTTLENKLSTFCFLGDSTLRGTGCLAPATEKNCHLGAEALSLQWPLEWRASLQCWPSPPS